MTTIHNGVHLPLEQAANDIIFGSLKGVTSQSAKSDILTPWKEQDRRNREIYTATGVPDAQIRRGMFHRRPNKARPDLNSREGIVRSARSMGQTTGSSFTGADSDG